MFEVGNRVEDVSRYSTRGLRHGAVTEIRCDGITVQWDAWQDGEDFIPIRVETVDADEISVA